MRRALPLFVLFATLLALPSSAQLVDEYRTIDGHGNNPYHPSWGAADIALLRQVPPDYENGYSSPSGYDRPNVRHISNVVVDQPILPMAYFGPTNMFWLWGQFVDHDIDLTPTLGEDGFCEEPFDIEVPLGDPYFDPYGTGEEVIELCRSEFSHLTVDRIRQQVNAITAFIDASNVYGSDKKRAKTLRMLDGTGRLKVTQTGVGDLLPYNIYGLPNAGLPGQDPASLFLAGDVRSNENIALTAMHTLWVREHNYWAEKLAADYPSPHAISDEVLYQNARAIVEAEMQHITFDEFLPILLGPDAIPPYHGYDPWINPGISNIFSTAAYRFGHTMLTHLLFRRLKDGTPIPQGDIALQFAFFAPGELELGIESLLRGAAWQRANDVDPFIVDDVRNFLFGPPGAGGFDLASLNMQRGRDHGHPDLNQVRLAFGLAPHNSIEEITPNPLIVERLYEAFEGVPDLIDPWVGGLAEPSVNGGLVGETWSRILREQFLRLRDGDRFWYQNRLPDAWIEYVETQTLAKVIRRNTKIGDELPANVFHTGF